jgi:biopolymer transport protein ExbB/TolQ
MSNPILESFFESDGIGQLIFLSLALLSVISWTLLIVRLTALRKAKTF